MKYEDLSLRERASVIHSAVQNGLRSLPDIIKAYNEVSDEDPVEHMLPELEVVYDKSAMDKANNSNARFVQRIKDPNRQTIKDWEDPNAVATHKLGWATDDNGDAIVYPNVQQIGNKLHDFTNPIYKHKEWDAFDNALRTDNYIKMTPEEAKWYTENYKKYSPGFDQYAYGGGLGHIFEGKGDKPNIFQKAWNAIGDGFNWLDETVSNIEPTVAAAQLATGLASIAAPESLIAPASYVASNIAGGLLDGYQALRAGYKAFTDDNVEHFYQSPHLVDAGVNLGELGLDMLGAKVIKNLNVAKTAGVTAAKSGRTIKATTRVGTGVGRMAAKKAAARRATFNAGRQQALKEANEQLAKRGIRAAQGEYYQAKLTEEMAKRGYGVSASTAASSMAKTAKQNAVANYAVSSIGSIYDIFGKQKANGGKLNFLEKPFSYSPLPVVRY